MLPIMSNVDKLAAVARALDDHTALVEQRNDLIAQCRAEGVPWEKICEASHLKRQAAYNALQRAISKSKK